MTAHEDPELMNWIFCLANQTPRRSGGFLKKLGDAVVHADRDNYLLLRPALLEMKKKYSEYDVPPPMLDIEEI